MKEELKTLKDFEDFSKSQTGNRMLEKIRREAIKWVKHYKSANPYHPNYAQGAIDALTLLHNITEEDLDGT